MKIDYRCCECGKAFSKEGVVYLCGECGPKRKRGEALRGVLRIDLPADELRRTLDPVRFHPHQLLPLGPEKIPSYPVGDTPLIAPERLRSDLGFEHLFIKDDGLNPTGSLKDRASLLVAAQALSLGITEIVMASTGNAASAMAGVAAHCGLETRVFVPASAPAAKLAQCRIFGAEVVTVDGTYDEAFELSLEESEKTGALNRNTAFNPMTIEGKKTAALEIFRDLRWCAPDVVFVPVGDGVIISGIFKGFLDLKELGWIREVPRLVAVQAEGSDAVVRGIETGSVEPRRGARTVADSILVEAPRNGIMALQDVAASKGFGVTVSDEAILAARRRLGRTAGIFAEPAAAAAFAGFLKVKEKLDPASTIVILVTGSGLKDTSL